MSAFTTPSLAFIQGLGWTEVVVVLFLILLLFGAKRLPELARSFGKSIREFKKATSEIESDIRSAIDDDTPTPARPAVKQSAPTQSAPARPAPAQTEKNGSE